MRRALKLFSPRFLRFGPALILGLVLSACSNTTSLQMPSIFGSAPPPAKVAPQEPPPPVAAPQPAVQQAPIAPPAPAGPPPLTAGGSVNVALLLPLSGPAAATGQALFQAAQLALFEIANDKFKLQPYDTKGTRDGATNAAKLAIAAQPAIILGPLFSGDTKAAAPLARQAGIPMISFTPDPSAVGDNVYSLGFLPGPQAARIAAYAKSQNRGRVAILAPDNDYGRIVAEGLINSSASIGASVSDVQYYAANTGDMSGPVQDLVKQAAKGSDDPGFDALLLPDEGQRLRSVAEALPLFGVDLTKIKPLGTMLWAESKPGSAASLVGGWYPAPALAQHAEFDRRYAKAFGSAPPKIASLGYDAVALTAVLAKQNPPSFAPEALSNSRGFAGIDGLFRLRPDGTSERAYSIYEVEANGPDKEIEPAPTRFSAALTN